MSFAMESLRSMSTSSTILRLFCRAFFPTDNPLYLGGCSRLRLAAADSPAMLSFLVLAAVFLTGVLGLALVVSRAWSAFETSAKRASPLDGSTSETSIESEEGKLSSSLSAAGGSADDGELFL